MLPLLAIRARQIRVSVASCLLRSTSSHVSSLSPSADIMRLVTACSSLRSTFRLIRVPRRLAVVPLGRTRVLCAFQVRSRETSIGVASVPRRRANGLVRIRGSAAVVCRCIAALGRERRTVRLVGVARGLALGADRGAGLIEGRGGGGGTFGEGIRQVDASEAGFSLSVAGGLGEVLHCETAVLSLFTAVGGELGAKGLVGVLDGLALCSDGGTVCGVGLPGT